LETFGDVYEVNFPLKRKQNNAKKINKSESPWMTNCILRSVRKKNKLYKTFLTNPNGKMNNCTKITKIN
jgi:hypothetical protein